MHDRINPNNSSETYSSEIGCQNLSSKYFCNENEANSRVDTKTCYLWSLVTQTFCYFLTVDFNLDKLNWYVIENRFFSEVAKH